MVFMKSVFYYDFSLCKLGIAEEDGAVCRIFFNNKPLPAQFKDCEKKETPLIKKTAKELEEYFSGKRKIFTIPINLKGTEFQLKVWAALQNIPYGECRSYGQIAADTGNSKACRAVGMANNRNPIPIIVPCHRVIGSNASLTGYAGGLELKQKLLEVEKKVT
jgi:methylated-DNA-[protein]-cysteine S-methyltransferase